MKKPTTSKGNSDNFGDWIFVNFSLSDQEKKESANWMESADILGLVERSLDNGYKLSLTLDQKKGRFIASLSAKEGKNAKKILTARAGDVMLAMARVMFLDRVIFDGGDWLEREDGSDDQW